MTFQVLQCKLANSIGFTGGIAEPIWPLHPWYAMPVDFLCSPWVSNPRGSSQGIVLVLCWWDEKWFTVAMYIQACTTCETAGSPNCSTSGQDGPGVPDADFVVYVAARSFQCGATTLGYAAHCFQDKSDDRYTHCSCYMPSGCVCLCVLCVMMCGVHTLYTLSCTRQHINLECIQLDFGSLMIDLQIMYKILTSYAK